MPIWLTLALAALAAAAPARVPAPAQISVAAASDLTFAFREVAEGFEAKTGAHVNLTFGSSGNFFSQIENGAPFDLFFSADAGYPRQLEADGFVAPGSLYAYARGKLVLWVPNGSPLDLRQGLRALLDPRVRKIAIANPEHAPYGRAAMAALRHDGIDAQVRDRLVMGENIAQTAQFVMARDAEAGLLALALAVSPGLKDQGRYAEVPASSYPALDQAGVILKRSRHQALARRFMAFLREPETLDLMRRYGLERADPGGPGAR